jgi:hypothetical protein
MPVVPLMTLVPLVTILASAAVPSMTLPDNDRMNRIS